MRIAVVSDIHANWDALESVSRDMDRIGVDRIISLGDNVGYGAEPEQVVQWLRKHGGVSVLGNHERALINPSFRRGFNPSARTALMINQQMLSIASFQWMNSLDPFLVSGGARFVHGMPPDMVDRYISRESDARITGVMAVLKEPLCFVGHTHKLLIYVLDGRGLKRKKFEKTRVFLAKGERYIINTGSIGQPRDGYNEAKYVVWDLWENSLEARFVAYDTARAAKKIKAAGIPRLYAQILESDKQH